jgi:hypothetical protein
MSRYYDKSLRTEVLDYNPMNPDHIELPPEHIFWQPLPDGHRLTYDVDGVPNGSGPEVNLEYQIRLELMSNGITQSKLNLELFKDSQALPNDLATIYSTIQTIATNNSVTNEEVISVLG